MQLILAADPAQKLQAAAEETEFGSGLYRAYFDDVAAGLYRVHHYNAAGRLLWVVWVWVAAPDGIYHASESFNFVDLTPVLDHLPETGRASAGVFEWTEEQRAGILSRLGIGDPETVEPVVITPAAPGETTGYAVVRDSANAPKPGVIVSVILANVKQNADGNMWQKQARSFTSQANGLVEITHLIPGQAYYITVGNVQEFVTIPASAAAAYALRDIAFT